jgi:hypothetical protein
LAFEQIEQREAQAAAKIEAEHQARLEEQSKLKQVYQTYLGSSLSVRNWAVFTAGLLGVFVEGE